MRRSFIILLMLAALAVAMPAGAQPLWLRLPPTPALPEPEASGIAPVNGIRLWYAEFGHVRRSSWSTAAWRIQITGDCRCPFSPRTTM